jgi:hypothetical protein
VTATRRRALQLLKRGKELATADYEYQPLIFHLREVVNRLPRSKYSAVIDPDLAGRLEELLELEIRPAIRAAREEYVGLFGFAWGDWVRVQNPGVAAVELEPRDLLFRFDKIMQYGWLMGRALRANGRPGPRSVQTMLRPGVTKVTVLSAAKDRAATPIKRRSR